MKRTLSLAALLLSTVSFASVKIEEEIYVMGQRPEVIQEIIKSGSVEIDHVTSQGFEVYGAIGLSEYLDSKNLAYYDMKQMNKLAFAAYPTFAEFTDRLMAAQRKNPGIIKVFSIGKSNKGKDLWMVKISDNVASDEVEPEFKYISSMHGDEITGREMTTYLIEEIADKYGKDQELTDLVNSTEIYIMPSMNPDGSEMKQRANAKGVDLNRNFPDWTSTTENSMTGREIENQAVMKFQATRQFSLSANFHGGTIVANYPWDSKYDLFPLDDLVKDLSQVYSDHNPEMKSSDEFPGGITNGAAWYVVKGGMQDWSYIWFNDLQITLEISHIKYPSYSDIPGFYQSNRQSMLEFMKMVHQGAGFKLARKSVDGTVAIRQVAPTTRDLGSYAFRGSEFYKVMPEGDYEFTVSDKSGNSQKVKVSTNGEFANLD
jgi:Zinc carboxypeptidase